MSVEETLDYDEMPQEEEASQEDQATVKIVNADEAVPDEMEIEFRERESVDYVGYDGVKRKRIRWIKRTAIISTYVPMSLFKRMLKSVQATPAITKGDNDASSIGMMSEWVLQVWKLSEEDMTLVRLEDGLGGEKTFELFFDFFGGMLASIGKIKAMTAAISSKG